MKFLVQAVYTPWFEKDASHITHSKQSDKNATHSPDSSISGECSMCALSSALTPASARRRLPVDGHTRSDKFLIQPNTWSLGLRLANIQRCLNSYLTRRLCTFCLKTFKAYRILGKKPVGLEKKSPLHKLELWWFVYELKSLRGKIMNFKSTYIIWSSPLLN